MMTREMPADGFPRRLIRPRWTKSHPVQLVTSGDDRWWVEVPAFHVRMPTWPTALAAVEDWNRYVGEAK